MADFNWNDHPQVQENATFNWNDHPVLEGTASNDVSSLVKEGGLPAAALREAANGVLFNAYAPVTGAVATAGDLPEILSGKKTLGDAYRANRDKYQAILDETQKQYPVASLASQVAGGVMNPVAKAILAQGTLKGAATVGGLYGLGGSRADLTLGQYGQAAKDTALGAGLGAAAHGIVSTFSPSNLASQAENLAAMHLGEGADAAAGRAALDAKAINFGGKVADTAKNLGNAIEASPPATPGEFIEGPFPNFPPKPGTPLMTQGNPGPSEALFAAKEAADQTSQAAPSLVDQLTDRGAAAAAGMSLLHGNIVPALGYGARVLTKGRLASSGAVSLDGLSKILSYAPQSLGQFAYPLMNAAKNGRDSLAVTNFLLGQQYPQYRQLLTQNGDTQ